MATSSSMEMMKRLKQRKMRVAPLNGTQLKLPQRKQNSNRKLCETAGKKESKKTMSWAKSASDLSTTKKRYLMMMTISKMCPEKTLMRSSMTVKKRTLQSVSIKNV